MSGDQGSGRGLESGAGPGSARRAEAAMEVLDERGREGLATVFTARFRGDEGLVAEFVDSLSGSPSREEKWVAILSSQFGCPVGCRFCDAGGWFRGNLTAGEMLAQLDHIIVRRYPDFRVPTRKFKVQFARMGEPALNTGVLDAIEAMEGRYACPGLMPCVSTVAPESAEPFFERLLELKRARYDRSFQLQFSVHSTDERVRDWLIPVPKWNLERVARYGERFHAGRGRKVTLNFAISPSLPVDAGAIKALFNPSHFMIKLTPVNPTQRAAGGGLVNPLGPDYVEGAHPLVRKLREGGFDVVVSIGDIEENRIGSNCGQVAGLWRRNGENRGE
ncbi:MAG: radical SAM protein [Thermoplasmatota archaeon]